MTSPELKYIIELFKRNGKPRTKDQITGADCLRLKNFIKASSIKGPIVIAIRREKELACLFCLLSEKINVEFDTIQELFGHIKITHPHLHDLIDIESTL